MLFIGTKLGIIGPEAEDEVQLSGPDARQVFGDTEVKLRQAGFTEEPSLLIQWQPDA
ncbi:hypothetical protein [Anaeromyxobacter oryzisoli]|uniref:hypothetical protein n=1 Tax=Anaeromyxobacter oryzisoli TaxID=2925408 RepID=UPI001F59AA5F|nr:hypothetical protein [Anaeromyxobacter sp. SG63]